MWIMHDGGLWNLSTARGLCVSPLCGLNWGVVISYEDYEVGIRYVKKEDAESALRDIRSALLRGVVVYDTGNQLN